MYQTNYRDIRKTFTVAFRLRTYYSLVGHFLKQPIRGILEDKSV